jgi:hypothetical protein
VWAKGDVKESIDTLAKLNDPSLTVDILNVFLEKSNLFTLDLCVAILPLLSDLIPSQHEE